MCTLMKWFQCRPLIARTKELTFPKANSCQVCVHVLGTLKIVTGTLYTTGINPSPISRIHDSNLATYKCFTCPPDRHHIAITTRRGMLHQGM